jgi:hypothetical protein
VIGVVGRGMPGQLMLLIAEQITAFGLLFGDARVGVHPARRFGIVTHVLSSRESCFSRSAKYKGMFYVSIAKNLLDCGFSYCDEVNFGVGCSRVTLVCHEPIRTACWSGEPYGQKCQKLAFTYDIGPSAHAGGSYEIELVVQKIDEPQ